MGWMNRSGLIMAVGLTLSILSGCAKRPVSFELLLARIDALGLQASADTFSGAASLAVTSADKLRLLERARLLDPGLAVDTASLLLDQGTASVVGLAALDLFLEAGRFEAAFGLFPVILPPSEFPLAFAETLVRAKQAGQASLYTVPDHSWLILAYDSTGRTEFLYEAILTVLEAGDTGSARLMMDEFVAHGAADELRPSTEMLWHHGFLDLILNLGPRDSSYDELAAYADSALMTGRRALAVSVYAELLERYPRHSWQPYAAIARLSEQASSSPEVSRLPLAPVPLQGNPEAGYWYARMINQFPEDSSAALEYGLWLARKGFGTAALPYFDETGVMPEGEATASARLALVGMDSLPLAAIELAATYPDSALAMDSALAALFTTGSWKRFLSMNAWREVVVKRAWFWDTVSLALTADFDAAILSLEESSPMIPGFEVSYTMAALKAASGRHKDAAMYYQMSANEVVAVDVKARCMVRAGDSFVAAGDLTAAVNAYNAALTIDDFNHEAMAALRRLPER